MNESKLDPKALFNIGYGLYVVTSNDGSKDNGLIVNTVTQLTSQPLKVGVAINKANYSSDIIKETKKLNINVIDESASFDLFKKYGFVSGRNVNKFDSLAKMNRSNNGLIILDEFINSYMSVNVDNIIDLGTHNLFIGEIKESQILSSRPTMTYNFYQDNVKPKLNLNNKAKTGYVCKICGYVFEGEEIPNDFICPICKHGVNDFEKINNVIETKQKEDKNIMKYRCKICGQIVDVKEGESCPICGAKFENLEPVKEESNVSLDKLSWATYHEVGVAKGVDEFVLNGCRDHFKGECSEVGMYLAMSRVALREGYPEVALLLEKIAHEEAEHAAKFAEMLGEVVSSSTKENISKMLAGENGACASKLEIAKKAKELGYDAIHDAVHEMAKDEQRHGAALEAMLKRYF